MRRTEIVAQFPPIKDELAILIAIQLSNDPELSFTAHQAPHATVFKARRKEPLRLSTKLFKRAKYLTQGVKIALQVLDNLELTNESYKPSTHQQPQPKQNNHDQ